MNNNRLSFPNGFEKTEAGGANFLKSFETNA